MGFDCLIVREDYRLTGYSMDMLDPFDAITFLTTGHGVHVAITGVLAAQFTVPLADLLEACSLPSPADWDELETALGLSSVAPWGASLASEIPCPRFIIDSTDLTDIDHPIQRYSMHDHRVEYKTPKIFGCDHNRTIVADFGDDVVYPKSQPFRPWHQGLTFATSEHMGSQVPDLANCIAMSGGLACYSQIDGDTLRVPNALSTIKMKHHKATEQFLVDFSPIGDITQVKLSDCDYNVNDCQFVDITLPSEIVARGKTIIISLFGSLFLTRAGQIARVGDNTVIVPPSMLRQQIAQLANRRTTGQFEYHSVVVKYSGNVTSIMAEWAASPTGFLIVVDNPEIYEIPLPGEFKLMPRTWTFPAGAKGLLRETLTNNIRDYVKSDYMDKALLGIGPTFPLHVPRETIKDHTMSEFGIVSLRNSDALFTDLTDAPFELFDFASPKDVT